MSFWASLTLNVPLARAQLSQELACDTDLADTMHLTGGQSRRSLSEAASSSLACLPGSRPALGAGGPFCQGSSPRGPLDPECGSFHLAAHPLLSEHHSQSFCKTWPPCNFQFVRNVKIEGHSLQAACIKSDATFVSCPITVNRADGFVGRSQWLPEQREADDKLGDT